MALTDKNTVKCVACVALASLGAVALIEGIDGPVLVSIAGILGGVAGYHLGTGKCKEA